MSEINGSTPGFRVEKQGAFWVASLMGAPEWIGDTIRFDTREELVSALESIGLMVHPGGGIYSS